MTIPKSLAQEVESKLSNKILTSSHLGGGCISHCLKLDLASGNSVVLKWTSTEPRKIFQAEAEGLRRLGIVSGVKVPAVVTIGDLTEAGISYLVLEYLSPGRIRDQQALAAMLASIHRVSSEKYGFEADNFIGSLPQKNTWRETWVEFFIEQRLEAQARLGEKKGWFDKKFWRVFESALPQLNELLRSSTEPPVLLHGDLWSANVHWSDMGPVFIDPAVYFGNREADLAFTELFGGFSADFYAAYNELLPLDRGYQQRKPILNLYHLMTHSNLFGGHYIQSAYQCLKSYC